MMKKFSLFAFALAVASVVHAYDYPYLAFHSADGTMTSVSVEQLRLTVVDGHLIAVNADGNFSFALADLTKMCFIGGNTGVAAVSVIDGRQTVEVVSVAGVSMGGFATIDEATAQLPGGIYIVKTGSVTKKIIVR